LANRIEFAPVLYESVTRGLVGFRDSAMVPVKTLNDSNTSVATMATCASSISVHVLAVWAELSWTHGISVADLARQVK